MVLSLSVVLLLVSIIGLSRFIYIVYGLRAPVVSDDISRDDAEGLIQYNEINTEPEPAVDEEPSALAPFQYTAQDVELMARVLYSECRGEPLEGMLMVGQVVIDRVSTGTWGDTIEKVIKSPGQFARPGILTDEFYDIAESVLDGERFNENYVILYFRKTKSTANWHARYLGRVGKHSYYGYEK